MKKKIQNSYFNRIFLSIFSICLLSAILLGGTVSAAFYGVFSSNLREQSGSTAAKVRNSLEGMIESYQDVISNLSANGEMRNFMETGDASGRNHVLKELYILRNSFSRKAEISAVRMEGKQWVSTIDQKLEDSNASFESWGVFRKANETNGAAIYMVARDALLAEEDRIFVAGACRDQTGSVIGYILIEVPRSTIQALVEEYSDQYNTTTLLMNRSGTVVFHSEGTAGEGLGKAEEYGDFEGCWEKADSGVNGRYAWCRSDRFSFLIQQEIPSGMMGLVMKQMLLAMIPAFILIAVLGSWLSRILAHSVSEPVSLLMDSMSQVKNGDLSVRVDLKRQDEIGQLGDAFNSMTERIGELMDKVDEEKHSQWIAETRSLSLQMNPHFLYNTLDLFKWNAKLGRNQEIVEITVLLGRLLRRVMSTQEDLVTVAYEMEIITSFVEIQKKHYGGRLSMQVELKDGLETARIPKLVLQPIVENAIVHGFYGKSGECRIRLSGGRTGDYLEFCVEDNGNGMDSEALCHLLEFKQDGMHHIGLNNVQRRARLYGDETCGIRAESTLGEGTVVTLRLREC